MTALDWRPLAGVDLVRLQEARLQAHYAVQWLARSAQAFIAPKPDDSHMNFSWEDAYGGFATHKLQGVRIGVKLLPLSIATLEGKNSEPGRVLVLDGQKDADIRNWFGETAHSLGLDARPLDKPLPYKILPHRIATGSTYNTAGLDEALRELMAWFSNADKSIARVAEAMRQNKFDVSMVRCGPQHFDLSAQIVVQAGKSTLESGRLISVGLSPGDINYNEPYFFASPSPAPPPAKLPPLAEPGRWHVKGFTAAILPSQRILSAQARQTFVEKFFIEAVGASLKSLR
jgi:hypothetical protein